jgi:hypothetical protein
MWVTLDLQNLEIRLFEASMRAWRVAAGCVYSSYCNVWVLHSLAQLLGPTLTSP